MSADIDKRLKRLRLCTRYPVEHLLTGEYRSVFKGRGMDFDEIRQYEPGDEVRAIDWNVTARTGKPYIKRYIEERELTVWLLVDISASCRYGRGKRTKQDVVHEIAALLTLSAIRNNDCAGLILFSDRVEHIIPPRKGMMHAMRLLNDLLAVQPKNKRTDPQAALDALNHIAVRRSLVFLISDFLFNSTGELFGVTAFRHDFIAVAVNDPPEIIPPECGLAAVEDSETGETMLCDFNCAGAGIYHTQFKNRRAGLKTGLETVRAGIIELTTLDDCAEELTLFFRNRLRRIFGETGG